MLHTIFQPSPAHAIRGLWRQVKSAASVALRECHSIFAALLLIFACNAFGDWVPIRDLDERQVHVEYSVESLSAAPSGAIVTWRWWRLPKGLYYEQVKSEVNCVDFFLRHIQADRVASKDDTRSISNSANRSHGSPYEFPSYTFFTGRLISQVCQAVEPNWLSAWLADGVGEACSETNSPYSKWTCESQTVQGEQAAFAAHLALAAFKCQLPKQKWEPLANKIYDSINLCDSAKCAEEVFIRSSTGLLTARIRQDLKNEAEGKKCIEIELVANDLQKQKEAESRRKTVIDGLQDYFLCARKAVPLIDDRLSNPDLVADAIHSRCSSQFFAATKTEHDLSSIERLTRPRILEFIFTWRHAESQPRQQQHSPQETPQRPKLIM